MRFHGAFRQIIKEMRQGAGRCQRVGKRMPSHKLIGKAAHNRVLLLAKETVRHAGETGYPFIISKNPRGISTHYRSASEHPRCPAAHDRKRPSVGETGISTIWKVGFELSGMNLDSPVDQITNCYMSPPEE